MRQALRNSCCRLPYSSGRQLHSLAALRHLPPATTPAKLGVPVTLDAVAAAHRVPRSILQRMVNPRIVARTQISLARATMAPLINSVTGDVDLRDIELNVRLQNQGNAERLQPVSGALKKFTETEWANMAALVTFYEEVLYPIRMAHKAYTAHKLTSFHTKDVLKRGLSAFKQEYLDEQRKEQEKVLAGMKRCEDFIKTTVEASLNTAICNDLINCLRIAGENNESAHVMAVKVLDDMCMMHIPYDDITHELLRATVLEDGPFDDSTLLFRMIEAPERGEVSLSRGSLKDISADMLKIISERHQTPLDDGVLRQSTDTYPNLQRSPE